MSKSPLQIVKEKFESKEALVAAVRGLASGDVWVDRLSDSAGLEQVSNRKLLHLHEVLTTVKDEFGSRGALIDNILSFEGRSKDADYRTHFEAWPTPKLLDRVRSRKRAAAKQA